MGDELALRPERSAQAQMPPTARPAPRGARRGLLVLTAGPVPSYYGRHLHSTRPNRHPLRKLLGIRRRSQMDMREWPTRSAVGMAWANNETDNSYLLVATGPWIFGKD